MFDRLTERLSGALNALTGRGRLTEENIADALRQVRMALIEADVAVPVVKAFIDAVKPRALGAEVHDRGAEQAPLHAGLDLERRVADEELLERGDRVQALAPLQDLQVPQRLLTNVGLLVHRRYC